MDERLDRRIRELPPQAVHPVIRKIAEIDECRGWWHGREPPPPSILGRIKRRVVVGSAGASTRVDGRGLTLAETEALLRGAPPGAPGTRGAPLVAGYAELLRAVFDRHREMRFGQDLILSFHARLFRHAGGDPARRGVYRTASDPGSAPRSGGPEAVALRPAEPQRIPGEMQEAIRWTSSRLASPGFHPLLVVAGFLLEFLAIRPFSDGNGRLSRILANLLLLQCGYSYMPYASLDRAIAERRTEYYLALRRSQSLRNLPRPDLGSWLGAFLDALRAQARELRGTLEGRPGESLLSENQLAVLALFGRHREITNRIACRELSLPRDTAKQVLNRLLELNLLQRAGVGRATRYRRVSPVSP